MDDELAKADCLTPEEFDAYERGQDDPKVLDHIAKCYDCKSLAEKFRLAHQFASVVRLLPDMPMVFHVDVKGTRGVWKLCIQNGFSQGTGRRFNMEKQKKLISYYAGNILDAVTAETHDPEFKQLAEAKRERDHKRMAELIPILRERYGEKQFARMFKAIPL